LKSTQATRASQFLMHNVRPLETGKNGLDTIKNVRNGQSFIGGVNRIVILLRGLQVEPAPVLSVGRILSIERAANRARTRLRPSYVGCLHAAA
jgi:hypothetical protein